MSRYCVSSPVREEFDITFLNFNHEEERDKLIGFLKLMKQADFPDVTKINKFEAQEQGGKHMIVLIERHIRGLSLAELVNIVKENGKLLEHMHKPEFLFKVAVTVWDSIRLFRQQGLKDNGLNSNLIFLPDRLAGNPGFKDSQIKLKMLFSEPKVQVEYKNSHFMRMILNDEKRKNALTLYDLALINCIPKVLVEPMSRFKLSYNDEMSFCFILIEMLSGCRIDTLERDINFEKGEISKNLEAKVHHPFFSKVIKESLFLAVNKETNLYSTTNPENDYFGEANSDFMALSKFLNSNNLEPIDFHTMSPRALQYGLGLIDKPILIQIMANSSYENCSQEQLTIIIGFLLDCNFLNYAFVYVKKNFSNYHQIPDLYFVFPFIFFMLEKILESDDYFKVPSPGRSLSYSMKASKLHTDQLKQLLSIAPLFVFNPAFNHYYTYGPTKNKYIEILALVTQYFGSTYIELVLRNHGYECVLNENTDDNYIEQYGLNLPTMFVSQILPRSYLDWGLETSRGGDGEVSGGFSLNSDRKQSLLTYLSSHSLEFNEYSLPDVLQYLYTALEYEKLSEEKESKKNNKMFAKTLKTLLDVFFAKKFEQLALRSGICTMEALQVHYVKFLKMILGPLDPDSSLSFFSPMRVRLHESNKIVCYSCYIQKYKNHQASVVESGVLTCQDYKDKVNEGTLNCKEEELEKVVHPRVGLDLILVAAFCEP